MNLKRLLAIGVVALTTVAFSSQESYAIFKKKTDNKVIQLKGSDTILNLSQAVAEDFMKTNKNVRISVTGGGSGTGIAGILNKTIDIGLSSRDISDAELQKAKAAGLDLQEITIAFDGITMAVNKSNPVRNLTKAQLRAIYIGEIKNWKEVGGPDERIVVLSRDSSSGTHVYFKEEILRKGNAKGPEEFASSVLFLPSNEALKQEIGKSRGAIAYLGMGYVDDSVKAITVDGVEANLANVKSKRYPVARPVYWYVDKKAQVGPVKDLINFMLSSKGQEIVRKEGFVPVK